MRWSRAWARQAEERVGAGPLWEGAKWGDLVFVNETGGPLHGSTVSHHFGRLLNRAGLPKMRVHDLRHGAISIMAAMGVPPRVAMELAGHSVIATTMNVYASVAPEYGKAAMNQVGAALWG
ncbi:MAG: tyrosine-type recombinase/integrase [Chloroflexi bacterium]|nr:tyrosine-type recombinase/integrase [Chloroflexota bacterium]